MAPAPALAAGGGVMDGLTAAEAGEDAAEDVVLEKMAARSVQILCCS